MDKSSGHPASISPQGREEDPDTWACLFHLQGADINCAAEARAIAKTPLARMVQDESSFPSTKEQ